MTFNFKDKKVLITGATRGIGKEIALKYKELGAKVIITGTNSIQPKWLESDIQYEELKISIFSVISSLKYEGLVKVIKAFTLLLT